MTPPSRNSGLSGAQARAWVVALNVVYGTVAFALIGLLIDWLAGTQPFVTLGMALLGLAIGTYRFIREAQSLNKASSQRWKRTHPDGVEPSTDEQESGPPNEKKGP
ncbi:MAG: hypothetical protein DHS20C14_21080 [Phycisphaeraceae bacterium]|nr:MAG: hypothetical protein DHS20C14_21080 [Phycisphaeraceae bacterium]